MTRDLPPETPRDMYWAGWGDPAAAAPLPEAARGLVDLAFGLHPTQAVPLAEVRVPDRALDPALVDGLREIVGADQVLLDHDSRVLRAGGKSTPDLLRIRHGEAADAPDAVVRPADHDEVQTLVSWCSERRVALVPFGGGTSVVGGLAARRDGYAGVISVDLARLDSLTEVDTVSMTAVLGAGLRGPAAEAALGRHGLMLGHFPQSFEFASIGGFAATRSSGQSSAGYGRFDEMVVGLTLATPQGTLELGSSPANAAGPDLRELVLGSEGAFGVITSVRLRLRRLPETTLYEGWRFGSFAAGAEAMRSLAQSGTLPTVLRLSDESETAINLARPDEVGGEAAGGCLMIVGHEGNPDAVTARRSAAAGVLTGAGGTPLGVEAGEAWAEGRFRGPYLRDSLLDEGVLVETLETATFWSNLTTVYDAVSRALTSRLQRSEETVLVLCHISHVYETGCSLYFTVAAEQEVDPIAQWQRAKTAASDAMIEAGATITHHHAVGRDHLPWLAREIGPVGMAMLRSVKQGIDPQGVCNPGVLIP